MGSPLTHPVREEDESSYHLDGRTTPHYISRSFRSIGFFSFLPRFQLFKIDIGSNRGALIDSPRSNSPKRTSSWRWSQKQRRRTHGYQSLPVRARAANQLPGRVHGIIHGRRHGRRPPAKGSASNPGAPVRRLPETSRRPGLQTHTGHEPCPLTAPWPARLSWQRLRPPPAGCCPDPSHSSSPRALRTACTVRCTASCYVCTKGAHFNQHSECSIDPRTVNLIRKNTTKNHQ